MQRKRMEAVLSEKNLELAALNEELSAFSYSVSNDLRAPLRSMDGFSLVLLEDHADLLPPDGQDALRRIRLASQRMGGLIDDMLRLPQVKRTDIQIERVDLSAMCAGIAVTIQQANPARPAQWNITQGMQIDADRPLIQIVLQNLLENAWKFTGKTTDTRISIGSREIDGRPVFFVADNGAGFDMAHAKNLFGTFERLHSTAEFQGTGIGLALAGRIISRHEGRIWTEGLQASTLYGQHDQHAAPRAGDFDVLASGIAVESIEELTWRGVLPAYWKNTRFPFSGALGQCLLGRFATDMTKLKQSEEMIRKLAYEDPLTGLPNRRMMLDRLAHAVAISMSTGDHGASGPTPTPPASYLN